MLKSNQKPVTRQFREWFKHKVYTRRGLGKEFFLPKMGELIL
jgi:hypothetical protein